MRKGFFPIQVIILFAVILLTLAAYYIINYNPLQSDNQAENNTATKTDEDAMLQAEPGDLIGAGGVKKAPILESGEKPPYCNEASIYPYGHHSVISDFYGPKIGFTTISGTIVSRFVDANAWNQWTEHKAIDLQVDVDSYNQYYDYFEHWRYIKELSSYTDEEENRFVFLGVVKNDNVFDTTAEISEDDKTTLFTKIDSGNVLDVRLEIPLVLGRGYAFNETFACAIDII